MSTMLRSKMASKATAMGPPVQKRRLKESLPDGTKPQQRTSLRLTNSNVTDHASLSRSAAPEPTQSFKERLFARPKKKREPTPEPAKIELHTRPQTTIAPFFKNIQAAFGEETQPAKQKQRQIQQEKEHVTVQAPNLSLKRQTTVQSRKRKRDSLVKSQENTLSSETEEMLNELRTHYLTAATTLHSHALTSLTKAHSLLIQKLDAEIVASDEEFLQYAEKRARKLAAPLSEFTIRSEQRGSDGVMRSEKHVVRELVEKVEKKLTEAEREMEGMWREWVESEEDLERVWEEVSRKMDELEKGKGKRNEDNQKGQRGRDKLEVPGLDGMEGKDPLEANDDAGKEAKAEELDERDVLAKYEEAIQEEIEKAEEEVTELTNLTYQMMKDLEKDYRKAIIPDLLLFYTSIEDA